MSFGTRLRAQRELRGFTQQALADILEIAQPNLSRLERDCVPSPGADILKRLAVALGCSIDYLVGLYAEEAAHGDAREPVGAGTSA